VALVITDDKFYDAFRRELLYIVRGDHPERLGDYLRKRNQETVGRYLPADVAAYAARYFLDGTRHTQASEGLGGGVVHTHVVRVSLSLAHSLCLP
jgi:hypothetical protein